MHVGEVLAVGEDDVCGYEEDEDGAEDAVEVNFAAQVLLCGAGAVCGEEGVVGGALCALGGHGGAFCAGDGLVGGGGGVFMVALGAVCFFFCAVGCGFCVADAGGYGAGVVCFCFHCCVVVVWG